MTITIRSLKNSLNKGRDWNLQCKLCFLLIIWNKLKVLEIPRKWKVQIYYKDPLQIRLNPCNPNPICPKIIEIMFKIDFDIGLKLN